MSDRLTIGHGNGHNKPSLIDFVRAADADSFSCNEAHRLVRGLERIPDSRVVGASRDVDEPGKRSRSTAVVTKSSRPDIGSLVRQVSEHVEPAKFGPDRMLVASFYEHPLATRLGFEGVAHFALHPDATVMHRKPDHPLVREYREALDSAAKWMKMARRDGLLLVLTGDLQVSATFKGDFGPRAQLAGPLNMNVRVVHIDWILYDQALRMVPPLVERKLFDHTGFVAAFTGNPHRRKQ